MAELTIQLDKIIMGTARKMAKNKLDYEDCIQEGRRKILLSKSNQKTGYYVLRAKGAMQRFLAKEKLRGCVPYSNRNYKYKKGKKGKIDPPKFTTLEEIDSERT